MPEYRRVWVEGGTYFFTVVTYRRLPILTTPESRNIINSAWEDVRGRFPFTIDAVYMLPDYIHCIWRLPDGDADYSVRWKEIKRLFTRCYIHRISPGDLRNESRVSIGEAAIWQRRFWEHLIRDEKDLSKCRLMVRQGRTLRTRTPASQPVIERSVQRSNV